MKNYKLTKAKRAFLILLCATVAGAALAKYSVDNEVDTTATITTHNYYPETTTEIITSDVADYNASVKDKKFYDRKTYYEYNDSYDLNSIIDKITDINYDSDIFHQYNIEQLVKNEVISLSNVSNYKNSQNYDWYSNGNIDQKKLYDKILSNCNNSKNQVTANTKRIIEVFTEVLPECMSNIKKHNPNFNFNIALKNIDELIIEDSNNPDYMGYYYNDINLMEIDYNYCVNCGGRKYLKYNIEHEIDHLLVNKLNKSESYNYVINSIGINDTTTLESSTYPNFIMEKYTDDLAEEISGIHNSYGCEREMIKMITTSINMSYDDFGKVYLSCDPNEVINCFEPECQDFTFVYATLDGLNKACGYGTNTTSYDEDIFRTELFNYSRINLLKNAYIRVLKDYYNVKISYTESKERLNDIKKEILYSDQYNYEINSVSEEKLNDCVEKLDTIFYEYNYSK